MVTRRTAATNGSTSVPEGKGSVSEFVHKLYEERAQRLVIGLTGRTGSGCTTAAAILSQGTPHLAVAVDHAPKDVVERKSRIVARFATENWRPFCLISATALIASFMLESAGKDFVDFARGKSLVGTAGDKIPESVAEEVSGIIDSLKGEHHGEIARTPTLKLPPDGKAKAHADFFLTVLPNFLEQLKDKLGRGAYIKLFQLLGDNCRKFGSVYDGVEAEGNVFAIAKRIKYAIDVISYAKSLDSSVSYLVVDAVRNPYEADWLKQQVAGFYLVAINTEDRSRRDRLQQAGLTSAQIDSFDKKEYPSESKTPPKGFELIISQNIQSCLEKADIHLTNPGTTDPGATLDTSVLAASLVKYVSLMQHPGLVTPSREERCMHVAFAAKVNSGCISRQVGAAVTDSDGSIMSVGWNDVPRGQVPCLLRDRADLFADRDKAAFSVFERTDKEFNSHLRRHYVFENKSALKGRSMQYCFREAYNKKEDEKNQVHTRSLHAEENAFLQLAKFGLKLPAGSVLYTTASPCELCAKKAFQLGVEDVVFIDPYPGISAKHVFGAGANAPKMKLFTGAVGAAYQRLYEPLMALKDELNYIMSETERTPSTPELPL